MILQLTTFCTDLLVSDITVHRIAEYQLVPTAGHALEYPLQYLQHHVYKLSDRVKLHQAGGQIAREATPVSSPSSEQFNIVARAIYETVQPSQVTPLIPVPVRWPGLSTPVTYSGNKTSALVHFRLIRLLSWLQTRLWSSANGDLLQSHCMQRHMCCVQSALLDHLR